MSLEFHSLHDKSTRTMSHPTQDNKDFDGSVHENDTQIGNSEEIYIDPIAEKKVQAIHALLRIIC
jgi:hypothetical protein